MRLIPFPALANPKLELSLKYHATPFAMCGVFDRPVSNKTSCRPACASTVKFPLPSFLHAIIRSGFEQSELMTAEMFETIAILNASLQHMLHSGRSCGDIFSCTPTNICASVEKMKITVEQATRIHRNALVIILSGDRPDAPNIIITHL